jgi:hypothetical protein
MHHVVSRYASVLGLFLILAGSVGAANFQPAMIGSGGDSVSAKLHYPPKAAAAKNETAVTFYCEVDSAGRTNHVRTFWNKGCESFRDAVEKALKTGRFIPAKVDGRPTTVILGGSVFFFNRDGGPTVAVALATAEKEKAAGLQNYIQPQLISSDIELRRKMWSQRDSIIFQSTGIDANAQAVADVDAQGHLVSKKLVAEYPAKAGYGELLMKGFEGAKFIPAMSNGKPVAGKFGLAVDFTKTRVPDAGAIGSHLKSDRD